MNSSTDVITRPIGDRRSLNDAASWAQAGRYTLLLAQLVLALVVVRLYSVEGPAFERVFMLATAGFAVNLALPLRFRLPFFVGLSIVGVFVVFGLTDGLWLLACGLALIGLCHLPIPFGARVAAVLAAACLLAVSRGGLVAAPWSAAVWPILGSMFMFRLVLYMHAINAKQLDPSPWTAVAYFFMLPNLVFPLFPVVDYQTFRRTYYDRTDVTIYEQGLLWIARGIVHLLLYRFIYQSVLLDPLDVVRLSDLVQFMLGTFLLYLRVSGQFHLIVGLLHLFGFRLPETHKLYYLAHSFTELWRRINIYWTDFMMKVVFYPTYFRVKRLGPARALGVATTAVFVTTWILHSYQWFWLRGGFPLTLQDTLFWGILGALVVAGALRELKTGKKPRQRNAGWSWRLGMRAAATFCAFCFLWSLWSAESVNQWLWMLGAAGNVDAKGVLLLALVVGTVLALGGRDWDAPGSARPRWVQLAFAPTARTVAALAVLLVAAQPAVRAAAPARVAEGLQSLHATGLNARDAALQHRGYYEQLDVRAQLNAQVLDVVGVKREDWTDLSRTGVLRERQDILTRDLLPSRSVMWNGHPFSTNRWGMRDRDYSREKPQGTLRIALLGPSHVMGNGVSDGETFEALVEERLNREHELGRFERVEILNFGVDGYSLPQQIAMLEERVLGFSPDVVIATHYQRNLSMTERYLLKVVWGGYDVPYEPVKALMQQAGVANVDRGRIPVPFQPARRFVRLVGIDPRMPSSEAAARVRTIGDDVLAWSFQRLAEVTRSRGIVPVVLGLNAVIDDVSPHIPEGAAIEANQLPLLNLLDVFPEADRPSLRVAPWDDHPNAAGHRLIADRLYPQLTEFLRSAELPRQTSTISTTERRF